MQTPSAPPAAPPLKPMPAWQWQELGGKWHLLEPRGTRRIVLSTTATLTTSHDGRLVPFDPNGADFDTAATIAAAPRLLHYAALAAAYRAAEREFAAASFSIGYGDPFDAKAMQELKHRQIKARRARDVLGRELDQLTAEISKLHERTNG